MSDLRSRIIRLAHTNPDLRPHLLPLVSGRVAAVEITPSMRRMLAQRARAYLVSRGKASEYDAASARMYVVEGAAAPEYRKGGSMPTSGSSRRYFEPKITVGVEWDGQ